MNIVIAPGSFKGSLNATLVAEAIATGCLRALPEAHVISVPMADGGDGMLDSLVASNRIHLHMTEVSDLLGAKIKAPFGIKIGSEQNPIAVIEVAKVSGLNLIPLKQRNPMKTSTYGVGELILHALDQGCRHFIIGLGGSATCDAGVGALAALGVQFKDNQNQDIEYTARGLQSLAKIDISKLDPRLHAAKFILACDINNPLLGPKGAVLYASQKGAILKETEQILKILEHFSKIVFLEIQKDIGFLAHGGLRAVWRLDYLHF